MFTLTERRFESAKPILDKYLEKLRSNHQYDTGSLEHELRQSWNTGYQEIKDIMIQLLDVDEYSTVAAWYMEHSNAPGVVSEFQGPLANLYGVASYNSPDREEKKEQFWKRAFRDAE